MVRRHHLMIDTIINDIKKRVDLFNSVDSLFDQLKSILYGVYLVHDLSKKTEDTIVSYGERLSSHIVAGIVKNGVRMNSRDFIRTQNKNGKHVLDTEETKRLVKDTFKDLNEKSVYVVPGFIARDTNTHETTNLGRGGSDYTASIIAAVLNAEVLEIWTDVDGFMTADPKVIQSAYTINELSYVEAMELCNFGAKVIYPPTIYPVCIKNIPIKVKNTFNPEHPGTLIKEKIDDDNKPIKGISSIKGTSLITVTGLSMVGVIGVNRRIFTTLANKGISVFMVSQASSENSTSIGVRDEDAAAAAEVLNDEFAKEIETGAMFPMQVESGLATIAIVGENMKQTPGIAGKLFGTLGRSGISVIACAQGASDCNVSPFVQVYKFAIGQSHTCAIAGENRIAYCWGQARYGQLGNNNDIDNQKTPSAVCLPGTTDAEENWKCTEDPAKVVSRVHDISTGFVHTCATMGADRRAYCWGEYFFGRLGDNGTANQKVPVPVYNGYDKDGYTIEDEEIIWLNNVTNLSLGSNYSCALLQDSTSKCWGNNQLGQLGDKERVNMLIPSVVGF